MSRWTITVSLPDVKPDELQDICYHLEDFFAGQGVDHELTAEPIK